MALVRLSLWAYQQGMGRFPNGAPWELGLDQQSFWVSEHGVRRRFSVVWSESDSDDVRLLLAEDEVGHVLEPEWT